MEGMVNLSYHEVTSLNLHHGLFATGILQNVFLKLGCNVEAKIEQEGTE